MTAARVVVSSLAGFRGQWIEAEVRNRATVALIPNDALVHMVYSYHLYHLGRIREAIRELQLAYTLAPASPLMVASLANNLWLAGDLAQAERYANLAQELGVSPRSNLLRWLRIEAALQRRSYSEASTLVDASFDRSDPDWSRTVELHKLAYAALAGKGNRDAVLKARERLYPRLAKPQTGTLIASDSCTTAAGAFVYIDEIDAAYDLVDQCLGMLKPPYAESGDAPSRFWSPLMRRSAAKARFQTLATASDGLTTGCSTDFPDDCSTRTTS
jgi:tetratricopeptide (TPR) repeat protein